MFLCLFLTHARTFWKIKMRDHFHSALRGFTKVGKGFKNYHLWKTEKENSNSGHPNKYKIWHLNNEPVKRYTADHMLDQIVSLCYSIETEIFTHCTPIVNDLSLPTAHLYF